MLKAIVLFCTALFVIVLAFDMFYTRKSDYSLYETLLKSSNARSCDHLLLNCRQMRQGVSKQLWYQEHDTLFSRINSAESSLNFCRQKNHIGLVEQLEKVSCIMQEKLYYENDKPMQQVRYLESAKGCYHFNSQHFTGHDVQLWEYKLEGHTPPEKRPDIAPVLTATAQSVDFSLQGGKTDFVAHHMKAIVNADAIPRHF